MLWTKDEDDIKKLKKQDKTKFKHEGFTSRFGYVPYVYCLDMIKLYKRKSHSTSELSLLFNLALQDILAIVAAFQEFYKEEESNDIYIFGGKEYFETQQLKALKPIDDNDVNDVLIDLHLFSKNKKSDKKK